MFDSFDIKDMEDSIEKDVKEYEKLAKKYEDNELFQNLEEISMFLDQIYSLLKKDNYYLIDVKSRKELVKDFLNDLDDLPDDKWLRRHKKKWKKIFNEL